MLDLRDIVREHGGDIYAGGRAATIPGPGHTKRDRSLSLRLSDDGSRVLFHSFAGDQPRDIMAYLGIEARHSHEVSREEWKRLRKIKEAEERRRTAEDQAFCASIWHGTRPLSGSAAEAYLWSRNLIIDYCEDLRFHPAAPRGKPRPAGMPPLPAPHPAMVALVRASDRRPQGLHVTFVRPDGTGKAFGAKSRLMFGSMRGGAVHLTPPGPEMAVGEGIETCAAYRARTGLPVWSLLTTSQFGSIALPPRLKRLVIAADGDLGGMNAATALAERASKTCDAVIDPAPEGTDWADQWSAADV